MRAVPLLTKVRRWLRRHEVWPEDMVIAVSGGPDSVALLRALLALRPRKASGPLIIAHLNHQLRGADSNADEAFVRELHASLGPGVELRCERTDVAACAAAEGANLESTGRQLRYDWLTAVARDTRARWVATGHTADDQAETVLHRLLRGAGLKGLRGIAGRRELASGVELVRPLLDVRRAEVMEYLQAIGQPWCEDRSNLDLRFTRNRIRHELLPLLAREYNPAIASVLARLAEQAGEVYREEESAAAVLLAEAERPRAGTQLVFDRPCLAAATRHCVRAMFRLAWTREGWPTHAMSFEHWDRLAAVALGETTAFDLPGGIAVCGKDRVVLLGPGS